MYRAYLGEDYDGIGQYVLVSLSRASMGSGYKARVASGDFGGRRTFPTGTPVLVRSDRGTVEVFLGNIPNPCDFFDNFDNRELAAGRGQTLGESTSQAPWTVNAGSITSIEDGYLRVWGPSGGEVINDATLTLGNNQTVENVGSNKTFFDVRFRTSLIPTNTGAVNDDDPTLIRLEVISDTAGEVTVELDIASISGRVRVNSGQKGDFDPLPATVTKNDWLPNTWYRVKAAASAVNPSDYVVSIWADELEAETNPIVSGWTGFFPWPTAELTELNVIVTYQYDTSSRPGTFSTPPDLTGREYTDFDYFQMCTR